MRQILIRSQEQLDRRRHIHVMKATSVAIAEEAVIMTGMKSIAIDTVRSVTEPSIVLIIKNMCKKSKLYFVRQANVLCQIKLSLNSKTYLIGHTINMSWKTLFNQKNSDT